MPLGVEAQTQVARSPFGMSGTSRVEARFSRLVLQRLQRQVLLAVIARKHLFLDAYTPEISANASGSTRFPGVEQLQVACIGTGSMWRQAPRYLRRLRTPHRYHTGCPFSCMLRGAPSPSHKLPRTRKSSTRASSTAKLIIKNPLPFLLIVQVLNHAALAGSPPAVPLAHGLCGIFYRGWQWYHDAALSLKT